MLKMNNRRAEQRPIFHCKKMTLLLYAICCILLSLNSYLVYRVTLSLSSCQLQSDFGLPQVDQTRKLRGIHYRRSSTPRDTDKDTDSFEIQNTARAFVEVKNTSTYSDTELDRFLLVLCKLNNDSFPFTKLSEVSYETILRRFQVKRGISLKLYMPKDRLKNWERFQLGINKNSLYTPDDEYIEDLITDLETLPIVDIEPMEAGTQLKLIATFSDGGQALMKVQRFPRDYETPPDRFYWDDFEFHWAEIAAFHLDRVLGFYRVPPVAGRVLNMTRDIRRFADEELEKTIFISPAGNLCFFGSCQDYCDTLNAFCGNGDMIEASVATFLPSEDAAERTESSNPWVRTYEYHRKAYWETYDDICYNVRIRPPYNSGRRLLDIMDMTILDFIAGNMDRHDYETFDQFDDESALLHLDNGEGFGKSYRDEMSILAPVEQCCMIRHSTFIKLVKLYKGPDKLSEVLRRVMSGSAIDPVLTDPMLDALDRRVMKVLQLVMDCVKRRGQPYKSVIVDDHI